MQLETLLRHGATVACVDLPRKAIWARLVKTAAASGGTILVPTRAPAAAAADVGARCAGTFCAGSRPQAARAVNGAGADLVTDTPELARWLTDLEPTRQLCVCAYAYADGAAHVRVSARGPLRSAPAVC